MLASLMIGAVLATSPFPPPPPEWVMRGWARELIYNPDMPLAAVGAVDGNGRMREAIVAEGIALGLADYWDVGYEPVASSVEYLRLAHRESPGLEPALNKAERDAANLKYDEYKRVVKHLEFRIVMEPDREDRLRAYIQFLTERAALTVRATRVYSVRLLERRKAAMEYRDNPDLHQIVPDNYYRRMDR